MKKWIGLAFVFLLMFASAGQTRLENLKPVQLLYVYEEGGTLYLKTDTGDTGQGNTVRQAIKDMQEASEGKLLIETASYLVIDQESMTSLMPAAELMRPAASICISKGRLDPKTAAGYLQAHTPSGIISEIYEREKRWDTLTAEKGRYCLVSRV